MMRRTVGVGPNLNQKSVSTSLMESRATSLTGSSELAVMRLSTSQASRPLALGLKLYCFRIRPFFLELSSNAGPEARSPAHVVPPAEVQRRGGWGDAVEVRAQA